MQWARDSRGRYKNREDVCYTVGRGRGTAPFPQRSILLSLSLKVFV
jgi:hypothetical protein